MAKQTFTTGQVLTAAQMTDLQQTAMGGGSATAKTASYVLVAADAGTSVLMNSASATTITVNTALFAAGDTVYIQNLGAGVSTITAGTATVNTSASLALAQYEGGQLYFDSTSSAIFVKGAGAAAGGGTTTWTQRLAGTGTRFNQIAYNGTNLYVAVGNSGQLYSSPNGTTWTSRTSGFGVNLIRDVAFGNGLWVAVGNNGTITTSTDGTTWTARTANMSTNTIYQVVYANSLWVAVGAGGGATNTGGITYSSDGITWTRKSQTPTIGTTYQSVVWNGTNWIVGSTLSTNNYLYATTPSGTWTAAVTTAAVTSILALYFDGTRTIWSENSLPYYTTASTLTSEVQYNSLLSDTFWSFKYYNSNLYYFAGMGLQVYTGTSSAYPAISPIILTPTTFASAAGVWTTNFGGGFVGAVGYIIADQVGRIYTSF